MLWHYAYESGGKVPPEIEETIIDILATDDTDTDYYSALKSCSLVCRAFLPISRKHIFNSISINDDNSAVRSPRSQQLQHLLLKSPEIAHYIRKLNFCIRPWDLENPSSFEPLKQISRLKSLHISGHFNHFPHPPDWSNNPLRSIILHLLYLPTITCFMVESMRNFVISDLMPCTNLKTLYFGRYIAFAPSPVDHFQPIKLDELSCGHLEAADLIYFFGVRHNGKFLIDFSSLSKITIALYEPVVPAARKVFADCKMLTDIKINFNTPKIYNLVLADVLRPSMQTLENLALLYVFDNEYEDSLFGLASDLEAMRAQNIIKSIMIEVRVITNATCSCGDEWGKLDQVLSRPGWSSLKEVSLEIYISCHYMFGNEFELYKAALQKLHETQFVQLSSMESFVFKFMVDLDIR